MSNPDAVDSTVDDAQAGAQQSTAGASPLAATAADVSTSSPAAPAATAVVEAAAAGVVPDSDTAPAADEEPSVVSAAVEAGGISFPVLLDLFAHYVATSVSAAESAAEQEAATAAEAVATAKDAAATAALHAADAATAVAADAAAAAAAAAPAADVKAGKGSTKDAKSKPAAGAAKAKDAAGAAAGKGAKSGKQAADDKAAAEAAVVEAPPAAPKFVFEGIVVPKQADGSALCQEDSVPADTVRAALAALQVNCNPSEATSLPKPLHRFQQHSHRPVSIQQYMKPFGLLKVSKCSCNVLNSTNTCLYQHDNHSCRFNTLHLRQQL